LKSVTISTLYGKPTLQTV